MTPIKVRHESFSVDYTNQALPPVFREQLSDCDFTVPAVLELFDPEQLISVIDKARQTLLLASDKIEEPELIRALQQKADSGVRIYILLGDVQPGQSAVDALSGRCLIRTGARQNGALILVDHTTTQAHGLLVMGLQAFQSVGTTEWAIQLDQRQIEDCFRSFCKLFWEGSNEEYVLQSEARPVSPHPDGGIVTNNAYHLAGKLDSSLRESRDQLAAATCQSFAIDKMDCTLVMPVDAPGIDKQARAGVSLTAQPLPELLFSAAGNWLLPDKADDTSANWCLKLSTEQSEQLLATYQQAQVEAAWQYCEEVVIGELPTSQQLRFADNPELICTLELKREVILDPISSESLDSFLQDSAAALAANSVHWRPDRLAHQIQYQAVIHPPYCPADAVKDDLYIDWEHAEQDWQNRLSNLESRQNRIDQQQKTSGEQFATLLKTFFLAQQQSSKELNRELQILKSWSVSSATPAERKRQCERFEKLNQQILERSKHSVLKIDEARQKQAWEKKQVVLHDHFEKAEKSVRSHEQQLQNLIHDKSARVAQVEEEFVTSWHQAAESLNDQQLDGAGHTREVLQAMTFIEAEKWRDSFKLKLWRKHYHAFDKALEDRLLALKKIERDITDATSTSDNLKANRDKANLDLENHQKDFAYRSDQSSKAFEQQLGLHATKEVLAPFTWPKEELPARDSELRSIGRQRFLLITASDQVEQARKDAERLSALICVCKESVNA